ncbi:MAG: LPS export ABC transporter permease LptF, partial [Gammaproteobacteria bacterium]
RILDRYLTREVAQTWLTVTLVLLAILISNQFARILGDAATGKLPKDAVFTLLGLTSLNYLTILIPLGLFLSVMLAFGRLYKDSEMSAMVACGVGPMELYRPLMRLTLVVALMVGALSVVAAPWALRQVEAIKATAEREAQIDALEAGQFRSNGGVVFYAEGRTDDGQLENVFLERVNDGRIEAVVARRAEQKTDAARGLSVMVLYDGRRYEGEPGDSEFRIVDFAEHGMPIAFARRDDDGFSVEALTVRELLATPGNEASAQLHWRLAAPLSTVFLVALAVPLSRTRPRQGRYGKLAVAILFYIVYANLMGAGRAWLENGSLPSFVGLWWVHLLVGVFAALLLQRLYGRRRVGSA